MQRQRRLIGAQGMVLFCCIIIPGQAPADPETMTPKEREQLDGFCRVLQKGSWEEKIHALDSMVKIGRSWCVPVVASGLSDRNPWIQMRAASSLGDLKSFSAVPYLVDALEKHKRGAFRGAWVEGQIVSALEALTGVTRFPLSPFYAPTILRSHCKRCVGSVQSCLLARDSVFLVLVPVSVRMYHP